MHGTGRCSGSRGRWRFWWSLRSWHSVLWPTRCSGICMLLRLEQLRDREAIINGWFSGRFFLFFYIAVNLSDAPHVKKDNGGDQDTPDEDRNGIILPTQQDCQQDNDGADYKSKHLLQSPCGSKSDTICIARNRATFVGLRSGARPSKEAFAMTELERLAEFRQLEGRINPRTLHAYLTALLNTACTAAPPPGGQEEVS